MICLNILNEEFLKKIRRVDIKTNISENTPNEVSCYSDQEEKNYDDIKRKVINEFQMFSQIGMNR